MLRKLLLLLSFVLSAQMLMAQWENDSLFEVTPEIAKRRNTLLPDYFKVQFAGSMGMLSAGAGYHFFKQKLEVDVMGGFVPQAYSRDELQVLTLRASFRIWQLRPRELWTITPLTAGVFVTYTFGGKFSSKLPAHYPDGYYWWNEAIRPNIFIGGRVTRQLPDSKSIPAVSFYYEVGTNELKAVSYALNTRALSVWQILHAGVGVKIHLEK